MRKKINLQNGKSLLNLNEWMWLYLSARKGLLTLTSKRAAPQIMNALLPNDCHQECVPLSVCPMKVVNPQPYLPPKQNMTTPDRARNNGRSTDNVRTDWGVDQSTFRLAGHVDRSQSIVLKFQLLSVCSESLCIAKRWSEILGEIQLEPLFTICALKQTLGFTRFRSVKIFSLLWVKQQLQGVWSVAEKKVKFRGIFRDIRRKIGWYIAGISRKFSGLTSPKNNR